MGQGKRGEKWLRLGVGSLGEGKGGEARNQEKERRQRYLN